MYEIWKNETGEVLRTHPGPWADTQRVIAELNRQGLGVSARKAGAQPSLMQHPVVQATLRDAVSTGNEPFYIAYMERGNTLEVVGCSTDLVRLKGMYPNARIDQT